MIAKLSSVNQIRCYQVKSKCYIIRLDKSFLPSLICHKFGQKNDIYTQEIAAVLPTVSPFLHWGDMFKILYHIQFPMISQRRVQNKSWYKWLSSHAMLETFQPSEVLWVPEMVYVPKRVCWPLIQWFWIGLSVDFTEGHKL